ncbi:hypothetical protein FIM02_02180 [SAR202 cluster bacterium AD-802-E10_MRT_200m]|nr:hypothetical protein [SAR202 cluster bacterium AD-802-E10_MRT_200m]
MANRPKLHIYFDMDYTLIGISGDLRPGVKRNFKKLKRAGHLLYIWSGVGIRSREVTQLGLACYVVGVFEKPTQDYQHQVQNMIKRGEIPVLPDLVIDDYPEIVSALGGIVIKPYLRSDHNDNEMDKMQNIISEYHQTGHCDNSAFRPLHRLSGS